MHTYTIYSIAFSWHKRLQSVRILLATKRSVRVYTRYVRLWEHFHVHKFKDILIAVYANKFK